VVSESFFSGTVPTALILVLAKSVVFGLNFLYEEGESGVNALGVSLSWRSDMCE